MAQMLISCPWCRQENNAGTRFCRHCGRLLVEPGAEASASEHAPLYVTEAGAATDWQSDMMDDVNSARIIIRVFPADFEGVDDAVPQKVGEYALEGRTITIGRGAQCDIVFDSDTMISRRHAILRREVNRYVVADLGSSNGTFLNDLEIREPTPLSHGDRVQIGQHELLYLLGQPQSIVAKDEQPETEQPAALAAPSAAAGAPANGPAARQTAGPPPATAKYASVARLSSEVAASASRMAAPQQEGAELDAIRTRLVEASEALTRQAGAQAALAERRRAALIEIRERLADLIADLRGDDPADESPTHHAPQDLISLAERVADDPNDLARLRTLASRADELAHALRQQGPNEGQWAYERTHTLRALEDLHFRLQERI